MSTATELFAESTRPNGYGLNLGIREIRMMAKRNIGYRKWLQPCELRALNSLISKGMVEERVASVSGESFSTLTEIGRLQRRLLVLSRHIVEPVLVRDDDEEVPDFFDSSVFEND